MLGLDLIIPETEQTTPTNAEPLPLGPGQLLKAPPGDDVTCKWETCRFLEEHDGIWNPDGHPPISLSMEFLRLYEYHFPSIRV